MRGIAKWIVGSGVIALMMGGSLLVVSPGTEATVRPILFDEAVSAAASSVTSNPYVVEPFLWRLEVNNTASDEALLPNGDIDLLCGDGDGCAVRLFSSAGATTVFMQFEVVRLFTSGAGPITWALYSHDGSIGINNGVTGDMDDEILFSLSGPGGGSGTRSCTLREDLGRVGNLELTIGHSGLGPHSCLLRIED